MPLWRGTGRWLPQAISAAILVLMLYLIHLGLADLVSPGRRRSPQLDAVVCAAMLLLAALASYSSFWCVEAVSAAAVGLLGWTVAMLWKAETRALRGPIRGTAILFLVLAIHFLVRLPLEFLSPTSRILVLLRETTVLLVTSMAFSFLAVYAAETRRRLHDESRLDVLTGLPNRRAMEEGAAEQLRLAARRGRPCALLLLDIDHFKRLNDTWGHEIGDQALLTAGELLLRIAQTADHCSVARMGGEEFAMLLSNASIGAAYDMAQHLCEQIAALRVAVGEEEICFTASIGVSALRAGETEWIGLLRRADFAMYRAKQEGRNRAMLCAEEVLPTTWSEPAQDRDFAQCR
jgi:diguanylate cyclase (GGDEF)-like protein